MPIIVPIPQDEQRLMKKLYLNLCMVNLLPRTRTPGMLSVDRALVPRIVKLPRIPNDAHWQSFLFHAAAPPLYDCLMLALAYYGALQGYEVTLLSI